MTRLTGGATVRAALRHAAFPGLYCTPSSDAKYNQIEGISNEISVIIFRGLAQ